MGWTHDAPESSFAVILCELIEATTDSIRKYRTTKKFARSNPVELLVANSLVFSQKAEATNDLLAEIIKDDNGEKLTHESYTKMLSNFHQIATIALTNALELGLLMQLHQTATQTSGREMSEESFQQLFSGNGRLKIDPEKAQNIIKIWREATSVIHANLVMKLADQAQDVNDAIFEGMPSKKH